MSATMKMWRHRLRHATIVFKPIRWVGTAFEVVAELASNFWYWWNNTLDIVERGFVLFFVSCLVAIIGVVVMLTYNGFEAGTKSIKSTMAMSDCHYTKVVSLVEISKEPVTNGELRRIKSACEDEETVRQQKRDILGGA